MKLRTMKLAAALIAALILMTAVSPAFAVEDAQRLDAAYSLGVLRYNKGDYDKALESFNKALTFCDENSSKDMYANIHLQIALIYDNQGKLEEALAETDEVLRVIPDMPEAFLIKAEVYLKSEDLTATAENLEKYVELTGNTDYYEMLSQIYTQLGDSEKALENYQKHIEAQSIEGAESRFTMAEYKKDSGLYQEAITDYEACIGDEKYGHQAVYAIGICQMMLGDYENAVATFDGCKEFAAECDGLYYNTGVACMRLNRMPEAIEAFTVSYENEDYKTDAIYNRALCRYEVIDNEPVNPAEGETEEEAAERKTAEYRGIIDDLNSYLDSKTGEATASADAAYYYRGWCYTRIREFDNAIADFTTCIEQGVYADECLYIRGANYLQLGKNEEAKADFTASIEKEINVNESVFYRAVASQNQDDHEAAIADFTASIENGYEQALSYYGRAQSYLAVGDEDHYEEDLEKFLEY